MRKVRCHSLVALVVFLSGVAHILGCKEANSIETVNVSMKNTDLYQYPTAGGDEDGARISTQPQHGSVSEVRRNAETNWVAVYVYQPAPGFVGSDYAEIEILTGSDGASAPTSITKLAFHFDIHN